jgi:hypothetical protein
MFRKLRCNLGGHFTRRTRDSYFEILIVRATGLRSLRMPFLAILLLKALDVNARGTSGATKKPQVFCADFRTYIRLLLEPSTILTLRAYMGELKEATHEGAFA